MSSKRLQHVSTPYPDGRSEELRAFYAGVLGLEETSVPDSLRDRGLVWFAAGDGELELFEVDGEPSANRHYGKGATL